MIDLKCDVVKKKYGQSVVVDGVSFEVENKEFFSLLGPSGCGKTTTLRMIAGFVKPDSGSIYIKGELVNEKPPYRRDTGMVFQNYALFPHMTVFDNVAFGLRHRGVESSERQRRVNEVLDVVGLSGFEGRYPRQLSGGQQQRVALARVIVTQPALLLLDEPLSNLDLQLRQQMRLEILKIQKAVNITTIYVTHDQGEAFSMSDKIAIMNRGKIVQIASPEEIYKNPKDDFVVNFIGEINGFSCTISRIGERETIVHTEDGLTFHVTTNPNMLNYDGDTKFNLYVRQEQIKVNKINSGKNSFPCKIEDRTYLGSKSTYVIRLFNDKQIRATTANLSSNIFEIGESCYVEIEPETCVLIRKS